MKILQHPIEFYATCFVSVKYINLQAIVRNLPGLDKAVGTEPNGTVCEAQSSTFPLNSQLLSAHDSAITA